MVPHLHVPCSNVRKPRRLAGVLAAIFESTVSRCAMPRWFSTQSPASRGDAVTTKSVSVGVTVPRAFNFRNLRAPTCRRACGFALGTGFDAGGGFHPNANHPPLMSAYVVIRQPPFGDETFVAARQESRRRRDFARPPAAVRLLSNRGRIGHNLFTDSAHTASVAFMNSHASVPITAANCRTPHISTTTG